MINDKPNFMNTLDLSDDSVAVCNHAMMMMMMMTTTEIVVVEVVVAVAVVE